MLSANQSTILVDDFNTSISPVDLGVTIGSGDAAGDILPVGRLDGFLGLDGGVHSGSGGSLGVHGSGHMDGCGLYSYGVSKSVTAVTDVVLGKLLAGCGSEKRGFLLPGSRVILESCSGGVGVCAGSW